MILNEYGKIAYEEWTKLPKRFQYFEPDVFQLMPNHIHGIIILNIIGATLAVAQNNTINQNGIGFTHAKIGQPQGLPKQAGASPAPTIGYIVGAYKSMVANACLNIYKSKNEIMGKFWQRNFYEHIILNEKSYKTISDYIINNPAKWNDDKFNIRV